MTVLRLLPHVSYAFTCFATMMVLAHSAAYAACATPAGNAGEIVYSSSQKFFQYCDGSDWKKMNQGAGSGSGGCANPTGDEGALIYNQDSCVFQGCAGNVWRAIGPKGASEPASTNMIGHWKYDETSGTVAADSSGNGHNATMLNGFSGATNSVSGKIGTALQPDGVDDYAIISHHPNFDNLVDITIAMWVKRDQANDKYDPLLAKTSSSGAYPLTFEICNASQGSCGVSDNNKLSLYSDKTTPSAVVSAQTITDTDWHHVAVTRSGTNVTFYIDGASAGTATVNANSYGADAVSLRLGKESAASPSFDGSLDDLRFYGRALSAVEIGQLYALGVSTRQCNPAGTCLNPAGNSGDIVYNSSSNVMQYCNGTGWIAIGQ